MQVGLPRLSRWLSRQASLWLESRLLVTNGPLMTHAKTLHWVAALGEIRLQRLQQKELTSDCHRTACSPWWVRPNGCSKGNCLEISWGACPPSLLKHIGFCCESGLPLTASGNGDANPSSKWLTSLSRVVPPDSGRSLLPFTGSHVLIPHASEAGLPCEERCGPAPWAPRTASLPGRASADGDSPGCPTGELGQEDRAATHTAAPVAVPRG